MSMSDQEEWGDDDCIDMGDHLFVAEEPPTIKHDHIEGADSEAEVPTIDTHPADHMHDSTPDSSPVVDKEMGVPDPDRDIDTKEKDEVKCIDIIIKEEYVKQDEELDYEDDAPMEDQPVGVNKHKAKCPSIWKWLREPVDNRTSTNTETGETAALMESVLGIQSPEGTHQTDEIVLIAIAMTNNIPS